ncbi:bifunctional nuclease family protein [Actinomycetospora rhizophila]|uniref:Bifunctional nuclease family protein n=1 Tax=Actinomycetospora rhizophila TaxID=1416876 RepID=A0ABV9ZC29_9PSEU
MSEMRVVGVLAVDDATQQGGSSGSGESRHPVVLLQETDGKRCLQIWIGLAEAEAIALEQQGRLPERPLTHVLISDVVSALGRRLERIEITEVRGGTFYADLVFDRGLRVSARPSDSIAIALHADVPIHATEGVLTDAGVVVEDDEGDEAAGTGGAASSDEDEMDRFRAFLDNISPEDFGRSG